MIPKKKKNKALAEAAVQEASGVEGNLNHESSHETIWPNCEPEAETQHWSPCTIEFCTIFWIVYQDATSDHNRWIYAGTRWICVFGKIQREFDYLTSSNVIPNERSEF